MSLTIYQMPHSPYCIPMTAALDGFGVSYEVINITPHTREEVIRRTDGAYYQVPLLDHDGELVMESTAESIDIARYVDQTFAGGRLFPAAIEAAQLPLVEHIENATYNGWNELPDSLQNIARWRAELRAYRFS